MAKAIQIALALIIGACPAFAQDLSALPDDQKLGYCAGFYLSEAVHTGEASHAADGFVAAAARVSDQSIDDLSNKLSEASQFLVPFFENYGQMDAATALIDQSREMCIQVAEDHAETAELFQ